MTWLAVVIGWALLTALIVYVGKLTDDSLAHAPQPDVDEEQAIRDEFANIVAAYRSREANGITTPYDQGIDEATQ